MHIVPMRLRCKGEVAELAWEIGVNEENAQMSIDRNFYIQLKIESFPFEILTERILLIGGYSARIQTIRIQNPWRPIP